MTDEKSLQEIYFPDGVCFGCGPTNPAGLHLRSFARGDEVLASWQPSPEHEAFPGILNGGIIGTLLDCHSNVTAFHALSQRDGIREPVTVTLEYKVRLLAPTPLDEPVRLRARPIEVRERSVRVEAELRARDEVTATCEGVFVRPR